MPQAATVPAVLARRVPAAAAKPYVRLFYDELRTESDPRLDCEPDCTACEWYACTVDGAPVGGFLLVPTDRGEIEVLTLLVPPARGALAVACARAALAEYCRNGGGRLVACAYSDDRKAQLFITAAGFRRTARVDEGATRRGHSVHAIYYASRPCEDLHHG